jgi:hypothetical protein
MKTDNQIHVEIEGLRSLTTAQFKAKYRKGEKPTYVGYVWLRSRPARGREPRKRTHDAVPVEIDQNRRKSLALPNEPRGALPISAKWYTVETCLPSTVEH